MDTNLTCIIDEALKSLKYLVLNNVQFEAIEVKIEGESEILPYNVYKSMEKDLKFVSFKGFENLISLRVSSCNLQSIHWKMFEGLKQLLYLFLEDNNLKFIPDFAFYGTPNLVTLSLAKNNLLNIEITDLAGLLELEYLYMSQNNFSQLSELSFPPFPKLKLANFQDNPITIIYPNTFDVMNTTDSLIVGCHEISLELLPNSFIGLNKLVTLTIINVSVPLLKRDIFNGMPRLKQLTITGNITEIEFDTFSDMKHLEKLTLSKTNLKTLSMDSFFGLPNLQSLDLSNNLLAAVPPGTFNQLTDLKELYLQQNLLENLPEHTFTLLRSLKLIRLNENPWHCSCTMSSWSPKQTNKIKKQVTVPCDRRHDKGYGCIHEKVTRYDYENRVAPRCNTPLKFHNIGVFQVLRKNLRCHLVEQTNSIEKILKQTEKIDKIKTYLKKIKTASGSIDFVPVKQPDIDNNLHAMPVVQKVQQMGGLGKKFKYNERTMSKLKKMKANSVKIEM